jgi:hypothetical protein
MTPRNYRKLVHQLRVRIKLLEQKMSSGKWDDIELDKIPGQAFRKHTKAFERHIPEKYKAFTAAVVKGEKKVNASTLFPYEVYDKVEMGQTTAADAMWASLPDYTRGENALVIADVSGSMEGQPMATSVSLALYFAERNKGMFKDYFMTFSQNPQLQRVVGATLSQKMHSIENSKWDMNTNIQAAFQAILNAAIASSASQDEMPSMLYIISDMEFDQHYINGKSVANFNAAKQAFEDAGYKLPHVVFWNVRSAQNQAPVTKNEGSVTLVSGASASTFQHAFSGKTPMDSMMEVLGGKRYAILDKVL